ncbi:MAG: transglutaminase-like domain-containing protein [Bacteroidota bacterium]|nr:transglutaminase-like domain-containing protein [Bacteroidota bacterium]
MKKIIPITLICVVFFSILSCKREKHFISDREYRHKVMEQFQQRKEFAKNRSSQLFDVFNQPMTREEKEAMCFLYAYMPLSDLADYSGDFFLKNVRSSFAARDTFSWGKQIPEEIFRHFVLPIRVNNENLDSSRWVFFGELKGRIRHMAMKQAVLEINHWCHEKVVYKGTDIRTSSPLATVMTAFGRCGEESTFTVAALRSAGIPARQCYTPRWAHCDDNHAWVEVWVDGKWHFLGACEPEPDLDLAWFAGPSKRAMLVNTNVFGDYSGPEEVLVKDPLFTRINVLKNYTQTKKIWAKAVDAKKNPIDSAVVEFQLYNYSEFYPLQHCITNAKGLCSFETGFGDLLVWAAKNKKFGYKKITVKQTDTVLIECTKVAGREYTESFDLVPPVEVKVLQQVSDDLKNRNSERLSFEDKIRGNYEKTFIDSLQTLRLATNFKINADTLWSFISKSRGNGRNLIQFISEVPDSVKPRIIPLLASISEKDLRDVNPEVLLDAIQYSPVPKNQKITREMYRDYILCPRVDNEYLKPCKQYFLKAFNTSFRNKAMNEPLTMVKWIKDNITLDNTSNWGKAPITPVGSYELKITDASSRAILFVSMCRTFGIPARVETATKIPQYYEGGVWHDVYFEKAPEKEIRRGTVILENDPANERKPEYYVNFTLERFTDGFYRSLDYETDPVMQTFPASVSVTPGSYLMVTGNRLSDGTVQANLSFFDIPENKSVTHLISIRKSSLQNPVLGKVSDMKSFLGQLSPNCPSAIGKYLIIALLDPEKEPSRHFISDLGLKKSELQNPSVHSYWLMKNESDKNKFLDQNRKNLPSNSVTLIRNADAINIINKCLMNPVRENYPVIILLNPKGEINYTSEGYKIGTVDDLLKLIR